MHPLEPDDPPQVAAYSIQERLAEGPHGVAYLARTADDAPVCVIKLLPAGTEPEIVERLAPARRVSNSFVARVLDIGMHDDRPYVVREYIQGRSLAEAVAADGPLSEDALERVAVGVLTGLTAIHLAGLAHRGLSPHNVILAVDGPRITDIDLGEVAGEVGYRSPEQLDSLRHGPSADLFSWAATIVFAATGKAPFGHDREMVLRGKPDIGALEQPLRRVVLSALAKEAARRPTAQTALLQLLGDKSADTKVMGPAPSPVPLPGAPAPIQGVPVPPVPPASAWQPPPLPPGQPQQMWTAPVQGRPDAKPRRPFPIGLAAAVAGVMLLSGAGVWSASRYADDQPGLRNAAAKGNVIEWHNKSIPAPGSVGTPPQPSDRPTVTVPWARTPDPDDTSVQPLVLPSQWPTETPVVPELSSVPTVPAIPTTVPTGSTVPTVRPTIPLNPTVTPSGAVGTPASPAAPASPSVSPSEAVPPLSSASPSATRSDPGRHKGQQTPTPTASALPITISPSSTQLPSPTQSVLPTVVPTRASLAPAKTTAAPVKTTPAPIRTTAAPVKTTAAPVKTTLAPVWTPTASAGTTATPVRNPYTPTQVCGAGFYIQRSAQFSGGITYQLYNAGLGQNCVITVKTSDVGKETRVSATLEVQGGPSKTDSGSYRYYAGPVKLMAAGKCVRFTGSTASGSTSSGWANCG